MTSDTYTLRIPAVRVKGDDEDVEQFITRVVNFYINEPPGLPKGTIMGITLLTARYLDGRQFTPKGAEWLDPVNKRCRAAFEKATGTKLPKTIKGTLAVLNRT